MSYTGVPFGLDDPAFLKRQADPLHRLASVFEGVTNSAAAGATSVDIYSADGGHIVIEDDGHGIPADKLTEYLGAYGAGKNPRRKGSHFGIGAKMVMAMQNTEKGAVFTSWTDRLGAAQVILGTVSGEKVGLRHWPGTSETVRRCKIPKLSKQTSGTHVELRDQPFVPYQILSFLNDRFLKPPCSIKVWQKRGDELKARNANGLLASMEALCEKTGVVELTHSTLFWGIKKDEKDPEFATFQRNFLEHVFSGHCFFFSWKNIAHMSFHLNRGGAHRLTEWGIYAGQQQVMLIVQAKGDKVDAKLDRESLSGWDEYVAKEEVRNNLPPELEEFMTAKQNEIDIQDEKPLVDRMSRFFELPGVLHTGRIQSVSGTEDSESSGSAGGSGSSGASGNLQGGQRKGVRPGVTKPNEPRRAHKLPQVLFSDQIGAQPVVVGDGVIYVNKSHPTVMELLSGVTKAADVNKIKALISLELLMTVTLMSQQSGRIPTEPDLAPTVLASGMARLFVKTGGKGINFRAMGIK